MNNNKIRKLVISSIMIALATILSLIQVYKLPYGGSITLASMLPMVIIAYKYGVKWGLFSSFVYSIIQIFTGMNVVSAYFMPGDDKMVLWKAICVVLLDYILAYTVLGLAGMFRNKYKPAGAMAFGALVATSIRFLVHIISGAIFFGTYAEWFFTQDGISKLGSAILDNYAGVELYVIYSIIYNATYMIPEIIITTILAVVIAKIPDVSKKEC